MIRRKRTVSDEMHVVGTHILNIFNDYKENNLLVNRKYQRKLVWDLTEKQYFIDTILHKFPVPLFIMVSYKTDYDRGNTRRFKEIIDGLQRVDAIISFIKNEFAVNFDGKYKYFNLDALAAPEYLKEQLGIVQKEPRFDIDVCVDFLNYELPITTTEKSDEEVEDIFERINSTGRTLSKQELRQAGAVSNFSNLVRRTAEKIRGDVTIVDVLHLSEMPSISFSKSGLKYGVDVRNCFWIKNDILTNSNIRRSVDEEIIARIYSYILLGSGVAVHEEVLDKMYDPNSEIHKQLEEKLEAVGLENLQILFGEIFKEIEKIFEASNVNFTDLLFTKRDTRGKWKIYSALFLSFYELQKEKLIIGGNYNNVAAVLKGIGDNKFFDHVTKANLWNMKLRNSYIDYFKSKLKTTMIKNVDSSEINFSDRNMVRHILERANTYGTESQMYDFKIGVYDFNTQKINKKCVSKIIKTLTAMSNTSKEKEGFIIIGMADDESAATKFKSFYGDSTVVCGKCFLSGINAEVEKFCKGNYDLYTRMLINAIKQEPISDEVKDYILSNCSLEHVNEKIFFVLSYNNSEEPVLYDGKYYVRHGSSTEEVDQSSGGLVTLFKRFYQNHDVVGNTESTKMNLF